MGCMKSKNLCKLIKEEKTDEALILIDKMSKKEINEYSAPLFMRWMYNAAETDIDLPLVCACERGNYKIVKALLEKGAEPNKFLDGNWSSIEAAFVRGRDDRLKIAKALIEYDADVNLCGSRTPAMFLEAGFFLSGIKDEALSNQIITLLMDNGANPVHESGRTVLHYSVYGNSVLITENLISNYNIPIDIVGEHGETPLMWGAENNAADTVKLLLELGADKSIKDETGKTAYDYAVEKGYIELAELLAPE